MSAPEIGSRDEVQIFDAGEVLRTGEIPGRVGMAISPNCEIVVLRAAPGADLQYQVASDADDILLVVKGKANVRLPSGERTLDVNQGVLVPAGVDPRARSVGDEELVLLSMRTGAPEGRPGYVPNMPSGVKVKIPAAEIAAKGLGKHLYVFAMNQHTIGVGINATEEWNLGSLLRMNCEFERSGDDVLVNLPERMVRWYQVRDIAEGDYRIIPDDGTRLRVDLTPLIQRETSAPAKSAP
jgi:mannose-6-phosphate isomerase-like protein (cupin superfamily)